MTPYDENGDYTEPPSREYHFGYSYVEVGICAKCQNVRTLFLHSAIHTDSDSTPYCYSCVYGVLDEQYRENYEKAQIIASGEPVQQEALAEFKFLRIMYYELRSEWESAGRELQHNRKEVLEHELGCPACSKFFHPEHRLEHMRPVEALDRSNNVVKAHGSCVKFCVECEKTHLIEDLRVQSDPWQTFHTELVGSGWLCSPCAEKLLKHTDTFTTCDCSRITELEDMSEHFGRWLCEVCSEQVYTCEYCSEEFWQDDSHSCPEEQEHRTIKSYDFRPSGGFTFHGTDPNHVFLGFELEVEAPEDEDNVDELSEYVHEQLNKEGYRGYLKYDGSIDNGFEIVSQPHTLEEYATNFPWYVVRELQRAGFRSWNTDTCGFHVHVSKKAFGWDFTRRADSQPGYVQAHALRFNKLIYDNDSYVTRLAGRVSDRWASFGDKGNLKKKVKEGRQSNDRYSAVNVSNRDTYEIRVFKGSMRIDRLKAHIQFVHGAVEYTRKLSVSPNNNTLQWAYFRKWLVGKPQYEQLNTLLNNLPRSRSAESEQN